MSRSSNDDYERADVGRFYGSAHIGVFDRGIKTPDEELMEAEEAARTGTIPVIRDEQSEIDEEVRAGLGMQAADEDPITEKEVQR